MKPTTCFAPAHILLPSEQVPLEQAAADAGVKHVVVHDTAAFR